MTTTLVFLVVLLAVFLGWIVRQSINVRPWAAGGLQPSETDHLHPAATAARVGLGVFLAVITSFFMLSISAYNMRMHMSEDWVSLSPPLLLWINTLFLVAGSFALQRAWNSARAGHAAQLMPALLAGGLFTGVFVVGQLIAWWQVHAGGYLLTGNPANSFFYLITALHGLHLLGGLVAWYRVVRRVRSGEHIARIRMSLELCTLYWHFLLLVWFILFGLLLTT